MNILGYISGFDGCGLFRLQLPFKYLNKMPDVTARISFKYDQADIDWADLIIFQKQYQDSSLPYLNMAKKLKKAVVLEFDDLMTDIPKWNVAHNFYEFKKDKIINFIQSCDACTVSTDYLKLVNSGLNSNIHVLPNSIDMEQLESFKKSQTYLKYVVFKDPASIYSKSAIQRVLPQDQVLAKMRNRPKIVWWGSPTHKEDLHVVDKTLALLAHEFPELLIVKVGCCTAEFLDYMQGYLDQLIIVDPVPTHAFHGALYQVCRTGPTITVCPIVELPFNLAKSNLKVIESFSMKAAVVASQVENYAKTIQHGTNGFLCNNTRNKDGIAEDWYQTLKTLIKDQVLQSFVAENGFLTVSNHYNMATNVDLWKSAYEQILGAVK